MLGSRGARVALVEKQPDPDAFKRMCSHFIQASAVPTIERLGLLEPIMDAGAVRSSFRARTKWGVISPPPERASYSLNLRREVLDPLVRTAATETPGVEVLLGRTATRLLRDGKAFAGAAVRDRDGAETELRASLVVGADGRDSKVATMAGVREKVLPHGRFAYGGYFEGAMPEGAPDATVWFADPQWGAAFPTDSGLCFYAAMPTKSHLPEFKRDPEGALVAYLSDFPDPPPVRSARLVSDVLGKIEMPNRVRTVTAPGLALVGDAALATDPLFGVGCGWAFQSGEWLADAVGPALAGAEPLDRGLKRYRRRHARQLRGHSFLIHDYATGRKMNPGERLIFSSAARDPEIALIFDKFGTRQIGPARMFSRVVPRALLVNARHALRRSGDQPGPSGQVEAQRG
jgi:2-polyprenyl-6-methoxyphenol hydroxylase-like FAD-dependent oxidoreductase